MRYAAYVKFERTMNDSQDYIQFMQQEIMRKAPYKKGHLAQLKTVQAFEHADDFVHNRMTIRAEWDFYKIPRIALREARRRKRPVVKALKTWRMRRAK